MDIPFAARPVATNYAVSGGRDKGDAPCSGFLFEQGGYRPISECREEHCWRYAVFVIQ